MEIQAPKVDLERTTQDDLNTVCTMLKSEFSKALESSGLSKSMFIATSDKMRPFTLLIVTFQEAAKEKGLNMPVVIEGVTFEVNEAQP